MLIWIEAIFIFSRETKFELFESTIPFNLKLSISCTTGTVLALETVNVAVVTIRNEKLAFVVIEALLPTFFQM